MPEIKVNTKIQEKAVNSIVRMLEISEKLGI